MKTSPQQTDGHSALPWTVQTHKPSGIIKVESKDCVVCDTINHAANAAFIVEACNSRSQLLADKADLVRALKDLMGPTLCSKPRMVQINSLLAKMEGKA